MAVEPIIKNRDIIVVGQQPWDVEIGSNCKNIAQEFSKHNRVLYVNSPLDRINRIKYKNEPRIKKRIDVINKKADSIVLIQDNLWNYFPDEMIESINWIKNDTVYNFLNKINNKRFARSIAKAIKQLGFENVILFNDNDIFRCFYLKELLKPAISIYYSRDFLLSVDYWKLHGKKLEPELIRKSDLCTANSTYLANYCRQYNPNSFYVGQGCDLEVFTNKQDLPLPADVAKLKSPVIGYVGALQSIRLNLDLLAYVARQKPEWSIVLVGPEDDEFKVSELHQINNIHFLGSKDPDSLAAYINSFDVCLNPQVVNQVTIGNYPRKIDEYLAMGKPVVATRTEGMSVFEQHTYLGETQEDYVTLIEKALAEDSAEERQERIAFAATHTWENNVKEIYKAINQVESEPQTNS
ncbi:glycosyltransferase [Mucilaginibacter sp. UYCu711]|uniref:glycosyltransferase n=1 Tax=Mucilaginibacter sp. UYCu711 TaxID=3156339 RepID=UPI003D1EBA19